MTRRATAFATLGLISAIMGFDLVRTPPNPYSAPSAIAFGSGLAPTGGFCAALPR